jgi:D-glycero-alpha-D-manno-heptose-7-phosphate kinase
MTVNFAINMRASCRIETREDGRIILESLDQKIAFETSLEAIEDLARERRLELVSKLVHFFNPGMGFHLIAESEAPAGAGLAGSSALNIACIGALNRLVGNRYEERKFITIASNIETTVIRVPAGFQDYYSAFYGGTSCISFRPDGIVREALPVDERMLEERIVICYTGEPRLSGTNNWEIFKRHIDGDADLFTLFDRIRDSGRRMREALLANDWRAVSETMRDAYPGRKRLAPGVTTPQMDALVETALANGAEAAKVCGAGGGGCIAFFCAEGSTQSVRQALAAAEGAQVLDWKVAREGLTVSETAS